MIKGMRARAIRSDRGSGQDAIPDPSAHAAAWLRLCPSQRQPRHAGATSLARPQKHPTHGSLYRTFACPLPRLLEGEWPLNESVLPLRDSRTSETASGGLLRWRIESVRLWRLVGGLAYGSLPTVRRQSIDSAAHQPPFRRRKRRRRITIGGAKCEGEAERLVFPRPNCLFGCPLSGVSRQAHREHRALARFARHGHVATHHARELARDGKAEAGSAVAARSQAIGLGEILEQFRLLLRRHADAAIRDGKLDPFAPVRHLAHPQRDLALFRELAGVA